MLHGLPTLFSESLVLFVLDVGWERNRPQRVTQLIANELCESECNEELRPKALTEIPVSRQGFCVLFDGCQVTGVS